MPDGGDPQRGRRRAVLEAAAASAGMVLFALFVRSGLPWVVVSGAGLVVTAVAVVHSFRVERRPAEILGLSPLSGKAAAYLILACAVGAGLGVLHRVVWEMGALPSGVGRFVLVASAIGAAEELLYRGYVQGRLRRLGWVVAIAVAAAAHTAYKAALFAFPPEGVVIDLEFLAVWTLIGGVVFGAFRELSGSVLAPLAAHVVFDIIVYGGSVQAPWWVWS